MAYSVHVETSVTTPSLLTPPDAPTNVQATPGTDRVTLRWTASQGATGYVVELKSGTAWSQVYTGPNATATITGLTPEADYEFRVRAFGDGGESPWSTVTARTRALVTGGNTIYRVLKLKVGQGPTPQVIVKGP